MSKIGFIIILLIVSFNSFGQTFSYPKGVYMSMHEIINKSPSIQEELIVSRRTIADIKMNGGNDFKLFKPDNSIKKKTLKREYWAYSDGDTLYLNCLHYQIQPWYAAVIDDGHFLVIQGGLSMIPKIQRMQLKNGLQLGMAFGAIGGAFEGARRATLRFLYVIDKETNSLEVVSVDHLKMLLSSKPELLEQFRNEAEPNNKETLIKYLRLINKQ